MTNKRKPKKTPTERTIAAVATLRRHFTFRSIVYLISEQGGHRTSISNLSRIMDGQREASEALADAVERVRV